MLVVPAIEGNAHNVGLSASSSGDGYDGEGREKHHQEVGPSDAGPIFPDD